MRNEKYYRNWVLSEQILGNKRKNTKEHQAAWHAAGMLYFSEDELVKRMSGTAKAKRMRKRDEEIEHRITVMRLQDAFDRVFSKARHNYRNGN